VNNIGLRLRDSDRASVVTFNQHIRQVRPLLPGGWPEGLALGPPSAATSLFDAVTVALIAPPEVGRRRLAIVFTDGLDSSSFVDATTLVDVARRSDSAVFTVALAEGTVRRPAKPTHEALFRALAEATGGALDVLQRDEDLSRSFIDAFESFRSSYVLRYVYSGPSISGWHPIEVRVRRPGTFDVRTRQGYFSASAE
jgi:Ca-activated chloride channel family protein